MITYTLCNRGCAKRKDKYFLLMYILPVTCTQKGTGNERKCSINFINFSYTNDCGFSFSCIAAYW
jgi:hypothetical protein